jgi:hypothetical protein
MLAPLYRWAAVGVVVAGLGVAVYVQGLRVDAAKAAVVAERAEANAAAAQALEAAAQRANEAIAERDAKITELEGRKAEIVKEIIRVPVTTQCVNSRAVGAALRGLRRAGNPDGDGAAHGAGQPDSPVPPAP